MNNNTPPSKCACNALEICRERLDSVVRMSDIKICQLETRLGEMTAHRDEWRKVSEFWWKKLVTFAPGSLGDFEAEVLTPDKSLLWETDND